MLAAEVGELWLQLVPSLMHHKANGIDGVPSRKRRHQVLTANLDFVSGQQAIQGFWQVIFDMGIKEAKIDIGEVEKQGDSVFEVSKFKLMGEGGQVLDEGKYIIIWKQDQGEWKLHRDIFNSSMPAQT